VSTKASKELKAIKGDEAITSKLSNGERLKMVCKRNIAALEAFNYQLYWSVHGWWD